MRSLKLEAKLIQTLILGWFSLYGAIAFLGMPEIFVGKEIWEATTGVFCLCMAFGLIMAIYQSVNNGELRSEKQ